jgi:hypothetical protein
MASAMRGNWMASSRDRFTSADFEFLGGLLGGEGGRAHLEKLWEDPEALREILDLKEVLRGLLDSPWSLQVSPAFYFHVLVRHAFLDAGLTDPELADYVSGLLASRLACAPEDLLEDTAGGISHAAEFLAIITSAQGRMRFFLQVAAGNQFLVLTGLFPRFIKRRSERRGAPGLDFYEAFARQAFRSAADNRQAPASSSRHLFGRLAEALPEARKSLNKLAEEYVFLGD